MNIDAIFKNYKTANHCFDNIEKIDGLQEWITNHIKHLEEIDINGKYFELPSWVCLGSINNLSEDENTDNITCLYLESYHCPYEIGKIYKDDDGNNIKYIDSIPLSEEIEFQCDNGDLVYYYIGNRFICLFVKI